MQIHIGVVLQVQTDLRLLGCNNLRAEKFFLSHAGVALVENFDHFLGDIAQVEFDDHRCAHTAPEPRGGERGGEFARCGFWITRRAENYRCLCEGRLRPVIFCPTSRLM